MSEKLQSVSMENLEKKDVISIEFLFAFSLFDSNTNGLKPYF